MLAENLVKKERLEDEAMEERLVLRKLLGLKFGDLPDWAEQRLDQATPEQLEEWSSAILTANSLDELFKH